jgi:predicted dienelactone hydrolase
MSYLLDESAFARRVDTRRIAAIGHSSGAAALLMLAGVEFSTARLAQHCERNAAADRGCWYPRLPPQPGAEPQAPVGASFDLQALVLMDPALGPGFDGPALRKLTKRTLVVGAVRNEFLPFDAHARHIGSSLGSAQTKWLEGDEGHFVFIDVCRVDIEVMQVKLCEDRPGVDRRGTQRELSQLIGQFLARP